MWFDDELGFDSPEYIAECGCTITDLEDSPDYNWKNTPNSRGRGPAIMGFNSGEIFCPKCGKKPIRRKGKVLGLVVQMEGDHNIRRAVVPISQLKDLIDGKEVDYQLVSS